MIRETLLNDLQDQFSLAIGFHQKAVGRLPKENGGFPSLSELRDDIIIVQTGDVDTELRQSNYIAICDDYCCEILNLYRLSVLTIYDDFVSILHQFEQRRQEVEKFNSELAGKPWRCTQNEAAEIRLASLNEIDSCWPCSKTPDPFQVLGPYELRIWASIRERCGIQIQEVSEMKGRLQNFYTAINTRKGQGQGFRSFVMSLISFVVGTAIGTGVINKIDDEDEQPKSTPVSAPASAQPQEISKPESPPR